MHLAPTRAPGTCLLVAASLPVVRKTVALVLLMHPDAVHLACTAPRWLRTRTRGMRAAADACVAHVRGPFAWAALAALYEALAALALLEAEDAA